MHIYINTIEKSRTAISIYLSHFYPNKLFTCTNKVIRDLANFCRTAHTHTSFGNVVCLMSITFADYCMRVKTQQETSWLACRWPMESHLTGVGL